MYTDGKELSELVMKVIDNRRDQIRISPSWVANEVMQGLDPKRISVALVYAGCHLELRQIARGLLREKFEDDDDEAQHELFPGLQKRYPLPRKRGEEPSYVQLEYLSSSQGFFNVERLRRESVAKQRHADKLEAWLIGRFGVGVA